MSLINDALKRAKQAQHKNPAPPETSPPLRPVEPVQQQQAHPGILLPIVIVGLVVAGGFIAWFAMRSKNVTASRSERASASPAPTVAAVAPQPSASAKTVTSATMKPQAQASTAILASPAQPTTSTPKPIGAGVESSPSPSAASVTNAPAAAASPASAISSTPPQPALPKLQGIFYRPERPTALLNGKTVLIGSVSGDYRVVAIDQQSVTVVHAGQTNVLEMPN